MNVRQALKAWRDEHSVDVAKQTGRFTVRLGPFVIPLPNPGKLDLHDMHHVVLGVSPSIRGEIQVGAYEVMTHVPSLYIGFYDYGAVLLGLLFMPIRTVRWLRQYRRCRSFYHEGPRYDEWLNRPVSELRDFLLPSSSYGGAAGSAV